MLRKKSVKPVVPAPDKRLLPAVLAISLAAVLAGCAYPAAHQDWEWKQWNPNYLPLPGGPDR